MGTKLVFNPIHGTFDTINNDALKQVGFYPGSAGFTAVSGISTIELPFKAGNFEDTSIFTHTADTGEFTCQKDAYYRLRAQIHWSHIVAGSAAQSGHRTMWQLDTGGGYADINMSKTIALAASGALADTTSHCHTDIFLNSGDKVRIMGYNLAANIIGVVVTDTTGAFTGYSWVSLEMLGE